VTNLDGLFDYADHPLELITATRQTTWFNEHQLYGSAERYFSQNQNQNDYDIELINKLFAIDFYPEGYCSEPEYASQWCYEYSKKALNPIIPNPNGLPPILLPEIGERIYSIASTNVGPSVEETLPSRLVAFDFDGSCAQQYNALKCRYG